MPINHSTPPTFSRTPITIYPHGRRRAQIASRKKHLPSLGKTEGKHIHHPANVRSSLQFRVPTTNLNKLRRKSEQKKIEKDISNEDGFCTLLNSACLQSVSTCLSRSFHHATIPLRFNNLNTPAALCRSDDFVSVARQINCRAVTGQAKCL